jgi:hypothetical protein
MKLTSLQYVKDIKYKGVLLLTLCIISYTKLFSQTNTNEFNWVLPPQYGTISPFSGGDITSVKINEKWGFIDKSGKVILEPKFEAVGSFKNNFIAVKLNGKWGFLDRFGKIAISPQFDDVTAFSEGLAGVKQINRWGYIDQSGNWAIKPQYEDAWSFSENLARVKYNGLFGYIDKTGNWVLTAQWKDADDFSEGLASARFSETNYGFIDKSGQWVIKPSFTRVGHFSNGLSMVVSGFNTGYIDKTGNWVIKSQNYSKVFDFNEDLARVKSNSKFGFINSTGKWVIPALYDDADDFNNGLAVVKQNGLWGYIDKTGKWILTPQFIDAWDFDGDVAKVQQNGMWGFISFSSFSNSISSFIKNYVEKEIAIWQKKGEFEKSSEYQKRVNEQTRNAKVQNLTQEAIAQLKSDYAKKIRWNELQISEYDADNETFLIKSSKLGDFAVSVPLNDAKSFKENWAKMNFSNSDFIINGENFNLAKVTILNPVNSKKYLYDSKLSTTYAANNIVYNFSPIQVDLPQNEKGTSNTKILNNTTVVGLAEVDVNIPASKISNSHAYALIIGNEDYSSYQQGLGNEINVAYAANDASVFEKYCQGAFGVPKENIKFYTNATAGQMNQSISWINKIIQKEAGEAEVYVYYAGHGLPDEQTHEPYIIPVDIAGTDLQNAIKLNSLYSKLTEFPSKRITVFMDACFSGGSRGQGLVATRGVKVKPKEDTLSGNIVIYTSSSGEQSSLPYKEKQHGVFTYYLLKKLQESSGNISYGELYDYLKKEVDLNCLKINSKEQTPSLLYSPTLNEGWKTWNFKH